MNRPEVFSLETTELHPGQCLIEASAGTGKTYTIAGLFVRLIVEHDLQVRQILTVTYTVAATEELRSRVRQMLTNALDAFRSGSSDVPFIRQLIKRTGVRNEQKINALEQALLDFDQAPIHTIHSFCQHTLLDHAFESGNLFKRELVADTQPLLLDVLNDLWRKYVLTAGAVAIASALKAQLTPESFLPFATAALRHRRLRVFAPVHKGQIHQLVQALETAFAKLKEVWTKQKHVIKGFFGSTAKWVNRPYNDDAATDALFATIEAALENDEISVEALGALEKFTRQALEEHRNKRVNLPVPQHEFFNLCSAFVAAQQQFVIGLHVEALEFIQTELRNRTDQLSAWTFDDLINRLLDALQGSGSTHLVKLLRTKYKAALIDEFQDTDPIQYTIFQTVFGQNDSFLYLVGDPKQAIYGFRGADVYTYLNAAKNVARQYTLEFNWRAAPGLVKAINTIFSRNPDAFVLEQIKFYPVKPRAQIDQAKLIDKDKPDAHMVIWLWRPQQKQSRKTEIETRIASAVAAEIIRLVTGNTRLGSRRVEPADIAVLVPTNRQAQLMQRVLSALHVPSVLYTTESLFQSRETIEVQAVLTAIATPTNEAAVKAALATEMLGYTAEQIAALVGEELTWQNILSRFHEYLELWLRRGFIQMFRTLLVRERVRERLLQFDDGERRMTNLLHLGEVLHSASTENQLGPSGLLKWIVEQKKRSGLAPEEHQLRLERDEKAVKLVTIHRSKGLEYPIVFCPFTWRGFNNNRTRTRISWFHEPSSGELAVDLGTDNYEQHAKLAQQETLAENVRLLYVALTRAKHRCYFVWGISEDTTDSALAWVLHPALTRRIAILNPVQHEHNNLDEQQLINDLNNLVASADGTIAVTELPEPAQTPLSIQQTEPSALLPRSFTGRIQRDWRITSFSSITIGKDADQPDYDAVWVHEVGEPEQATGMFAFPRGARAGECLHRIFESLDFTRWSDQTTKKLIADQLTTHGISTDQFCDIVFEMLGNVLTAKLRPPNDTTASTIQLAKLSPGNRLTELEFCFPLGWLTPKPLHELLIRYSVLGQEEPERVTFNPVTGILKGYIDLVLEWDGRFYIVDWKSNWLGNSIQDYCYTALKAEINRRNYFLQYLIYTVAVDKYLRLRLPNYDYARDFGGVFYIFVRGIDPAKPGYGIYYDKPSANMIRDLGQLLACKSPSGTTR